MFTEREVLLQIQAGDPRGVPGLVGRHGALLHETLRRYFGAAGEGQAGELERILATLVAELRAGRFDDLSETFYDWVARRSLCTCMALRQERAGGPHLDPELIYKCVDRIDQAALPAATRERCHSHLAACELCAELQRQCTDVPVEVRHAGAHIPDDFRPLLERAAARCS